MVVFDCVATGASNDSSEFVDVLLGESLPLNSCSIKWQRKDFDRVHSNFWPVHFLSAACHSPKYSNYIHDGFFVSSALRFQPSDFEGSEYVICISTEAFCTDYRTCIVDSFCSRDLRRLVSPAPSHQTDQVLASASFHAVSRMVSSRHDPSDIWTECTLRARPTTAVWVIHH